MNREEKFFGKFWSRVCLWLAEHSGIYGRLGWKLRRAGRQCQRCGNSPCCREAEAKMARECPLLDCGLRGSGK